MSNQRKFGTNILRQEEGSVVCQFTRSVDNATPEPFATVKFLNLSALIQKNRERVEKAQKETSKTTTCDVEK
jgi:hypothetical protein